MERQQEWPSTSLAKSQEEALFSILSLEVDEIRDIEKSMLDSFARQTVSALESTRCIFPIIPAVFFDAAEQGIVEFVMVQSSLLDLLFNESHEYADAITQWSLDTTEDETSDRDVTVQEREMDIALTGFEGATDDMEPQEAELPIPTAGEGGSSCGK